MHSSLAGAERQAARVGPLLPHVNQDGLCDWSVKWCVIATAGSERHCDLHLALSWIPLWGQPATTSRGRSRSPAERPTGHRVEACCQQPGLPTGPASESAWKRGPRPIRLGQLTVILTAVLRDRTVQEPLHLLHRNS